MAVRSQLTERQRQLSILLTTAKSSYSCVIIVLTQKYYNIYYTKEILQSLLYERNKTMFITRKKYYNEYYTKEIFNEYYTKEILQTILHERNIPMSIT